MPIDFSMRDRLREVRDSASQDANAGRRSPTTISNLSRQYYARVQSMGVVRYSQYIDSKTSFPTS